jgi:ABC-2 type transport system ATP-binding protein
MEMTVEVKNLTKRFGDFTAVNGVSFSVKRGEIFGFLGPNGAGKSTTIRMLCGILLPSEGSGSVSGYDIIEENELIKSTIGYMSQRFSLYDDLTVMENLEFFGSIYGLEGRELKRRISVAIDLAEIGERRDSPVKSLPGGISYIGSLKRGRPSLSPPITWMRQNTVTE